MNLFEEQDGRELHGPDVSGERDLDQQRSPRRSRGLSGCVPWLMAGLAVLGGGFYGLADQRRWGAHPLVHRRLQSPQAVRRPHGPHLRGVLQGPPLRQHPRHLPGARSRLQGERLRLVVVSPEAQAERFEIKEFTAQAMVY